MPPHAPRRFNPAFMARWEPERKRSGGNRLGADDRLFDDRQVDDGRNDAERNRQPPDHLIGAGALEQHAAQPDAEEATDLMAEESKSEQRRHPSRAEHQRDK